MGHFEIKIRRTTCNELIYKEHNNCNNKNTAAEAMWINAVYFERKLEMKKKKNH